MVVGYIHNRINFSSSEQQSLIREFSSKHNLKLDIIYSDSDINELCSSSITNGDTLIISEISCLGGSLYDIRDNLKKLLQQQITVMSASEEYKLTPNDIHLLDGIDLAIDIRKNLVSTTTSAALESRKQKGIKLGIKKGQVLRKKLDGKQPEVVKLLKQGKSKGEIAVILGVSQATVYNFIRNQIKGTQHA